MSFIFSRALVEASLQVNCSAVDAYAPLSLIPTPKPSLLLGKTTAPFLHSRFGMTFEPLTDDHGTELLKLWLEAFHARTSVQPAPVTASMESEADYGRKWPASFARYSPSESKWKTVQCSLLGDSDEFSETWPRWGSMRNGVSYLRPMSTLPTFESGSGLWPTPCASASKGSSPAALVRKDGKSRENDRIDHAVMASDGGQLNPEWVEWLMGWPIGHTALKPLETAKYQEWLQQHGIFSDADA